MSGAVTESVTVVIIPGDQHNHLIIMAGDQHNHLIIMAGHQHNHLIIMPRAQHNHLIIMPGAGPTQSPSFLQAARRIISQCSVLSIETIGLCGSVCVGY